MNAITQRFPRADQLCEIPTGAWSIIATRVRRGDEDGWDWTMPEDDYRAFKTAVELNAAAMVQKRLADDSVVLLGSFFRSRGVRGSSHGRHMAADGSRMGKEGGLDAGAQHVATDTEEALAVPSTASLSSQFSGWAKS